MLKTSYGELLCRGLLTRWFPDRNVLYNYRPDWLKNPETGRNLEIDIYYPDLKLAVEFQGIQHRLLLEKRKNYFKTQECSKQGILMLSVYHPMDLFKCKGFVKRHTGINPPSGRSDEKFLWELKAYVVGVGNGEWYSRSKEESDMEEAHSKSAKRFRKLERRRIRRNFVE